MVDLDKAISLKLRKEYEQEKAEHQSSGKLSASQLSKPLLEQVLKIIRVPEAPVSDYALRLFKRGRQVEDWIVEMLVNTELAGKVIPGKADASSPFELQKEVEYKGVIGLADVVLDGQPVEVKSVKASQWRWLEKEGARWSHQLQAGLYALALDSPTYQIMYVVADDFRVKCFSDLKTDAIKPEIEKIMSEVANQLKLGKLPVFASREKWQDKPEYAEKYSNYGDWIHLDPQTAMKKLATQFPTSFERLQELSRKVAV